MWCKLNFFSCHKLPYGSKHILHNVKQNFSLNINGVRLPWQLSFSPWVLPFSAEEMTPWTKYSLKKQRDCAWRSHLALGHCEFSQKVDVGGSSTAYQIYTQDSSCFASAFIGRDPKIFGAVKLKPSGISC